MKTNKKFKNKKFLLVNKFLSPQGGAEISFLLLGKLLKAKGHQVAYFATKSKTTPETLNNKYFVYFNGYKNINFFTKIKNAGNLLFSLEAKRKIKKLINNFGPGAVILNNIYHQISPSIIWEIKKHHIPVIMFLRDYKLVCATYKMRSKENACNSCKQKKYLNIIKNRCNLHGNFGESFLLWLEMILHHKILRLYDLIDVFISPSKFLIKQFRLMGFDKKIYHLPNFVPKNELVFSFSGKRKKIIYFGRLTKEKGLLNLLKAVEKQKINLSIIGEGPLKPHLKKIIIERKINNISLLGPFDKKNLYQEVKKSAVTILPSEWHENCPRSILESFALGIPVLASNIGGIPELVKDGENGFLFQPGNPQSIRKTVNKYFGLSNKQKKQLAKNAYNTAKKYNSTTFYNNFLKIIEENNLLS